jgi:bacterioferritin
MSLCIIRWASDGPKKYITDNIVLRILEQEVEHEEDLQALLEDLDLMIKRV